MEVFREINFQNKNLALALGYFDGVHLGHKKIISMLVQEGKIQNLKTAIVTFDANPANCFKKQKTKNIQSFKDKEMILEAMGLDYLYELDFEQYKNLSANEYLKNVLVKNFEPKLIIAGYNHTFGKNRTGNSEYLKEFAKNYNYECLIVPEQKFDNQEISSTSIRKNLSYGNLDTVKTLLGRPFSIRNSVIKGDKIARELGYPTANLIWSESIIKIPHGVYYGFVQIDSNLRPALISWGTKPTLTKTKKEILEAHIYNYNEDLYGKIIRVIFDKKVRDEENFGNIRVLKTQLDKDYSAFKKWAELML